MYQQTQFQTSSGQRLAFYTWDDVTNPRGLVIIVHGMAEHMRRYEHFANFLNQNGYIVVGSDHRGHGQTATEDSLGHQDGDIALDTVNDTREICHAMADKYKLPIVLFGHSYGSFLTQEYILQGSERISGVVLSGTAHLGGLMTTLGSIMAKMRSPKKPGKSFAKMTFARYDRKIGSGRNAWLSRDLSVAEAYNADKLCGFVCSNGFYHSMLSMARRMYNGRRAQGLDRLLCILVIGGSCDPVSANGKLLCKLVNFYARHGMRNVEMIMYDGARHEVLNEINQQTVYADILSFCNDCCNA